MNANIKGMIGAAVTVTLLSGAYKAGQLSERHRLTPVVNALLTENHDKSRKIDEAMRLNGEILERETLREQRLRATLARDLKGANAGQGN